MATPLPTWVIAQLEKSGVLLEDGEISRTKKVGDDEMKDQIKGFLLEDWDTMMLGSLFQIYFAYIKF